MKGCSIKFQTVWLACLLKEDRSISQEFLTLYQSIFHKSLSDSLLRKLTQPLLHTHISHLILVWPKLWQKILTSIFWNTQIMPNFRWPIWKSVKVEWKSILLTFSHSRSDQFWKQNTIPRTGFWAKIYTYSLHNWKKPCYAKRALVETESYVLWICTMYIVHTH